MSSATALTRVALDADGEERLRVVGSLGNSRSSDSLDVLSQAMSSSDPAVSRGALGQDS